MVCVSDLKAYLAVIGLCLGQSDKTKGILEGWQGQNAANVAKQDQCMCMRAARYDLPSVEAIEEPRPGDGDEEIEKSGVEDGLGVGLSVLAEPDAVASCHDGYLDL